MLSAQYSGLAHRKNSVNVSSLFPMQTSFTELNMLPLLSNGTMYSLFLHPTLVDRGNVDGVAKKVLKWGLLCLWSDLSSTTLLTLNFEWII